MIVWARDFGDPMSSLKRIASVRLAPEDLLGFGRCETEMARRDPESDFVIVVLSGSDKPCVGI